MAADLDERAESGTLARKRQLQQVAVRESDGGRMLELETNADDRGRVIGRQGRVAKAMRALLGVSRDGADCRLDIVD